MLHKSLRSTTVIAMALVLSGLTGCKLTTDDKGITYGNQELDPVDRCLRNLKWQQQQNINGLVDKDASEGDRLVSAIILSNTNEAEERLKCESLGRAYKLEAVPEKPKSKKQEKASS